MQETNMLVSRKTFDKIINSQMDEPFVAQRTVLKHRKLRPVVVIVLIK